MTREAGADRTLTMVVPTYQRRDSVVRLLEAFAAQLDQGGLAEGAEMIVVVDGSTDGTAEAVEALSYPVPLRSVVQPNAGLAAARNRGLQEATGELVWFLDDDMVPTEGLVARHRAAHRDGADHVVMGPCLHPPDAPIAAPIREYAERWFGGLAEAGRVTSAWDFSAANTSAPRRLWREIGGFEARLRGWGGEDYEIAYRLLRAGIRIAFDPKAVAWHHQVRDVRAFCANTRDQGRNLVHIAELHPEAADDLLPPQRSRRVLRLVRRWGGNRPGAYLAAGRVLALAAAAEGRLRGGAPGPVLDLAVSANQLAGVADADRSGRFVARFFDGSG